MNGKKMRNKRRQKYSVVDVDSASIGFGSASKKKNYRNMINPVAVVKYLNKTKRDFNSLSKDELEKFRVK